MQRRDRFLSRIAGPFLAAALLVLPCAASAVDVNITATLADTTDPTVAVTQPTAGTYTSATLPTQVTGTAADNGNGVGLNADSTQFSIERQSDGKYWDGGAWVAGPVFLGTTHPATTQGTSVTWTSSAILPPWLDDTYTIVPRATDRSGNSADGAAVSFVVSTPVLGLIAITQPVISTTYTSATIPTQFTGTVQDASNGLGFFANSVEFSLRRQSDGKYWDGGAWVSGVVYLHTSHADTTGGAKVNWTSTSLLPPWLDDDYTMQARGTDKGGTTLTSTSVTFTVDNGAPVVPPVTPPTTPPTTPPGTPPPLVPTGGTITGWITKLAQALPINYVLATLVAGSALALALLPALLRLPLGLPSAIGPLGNLFAFFIAWLKRRRRYGVVYDSATSKPVEGAFVRLIAEGGNQFEVGKLLESKKTDEKGRYTFDVRDGFYRIEVILKDYAFPSSRASIGYRGEIIEATDSGLVYPDVPIDNMTPGAHIAVLRFRELGERIQQLRIPLSITGTIFGLAFFVERGAPIDYAIMAMYVVFWTLEYLNWIQGREVSYVTADNRPAPLTILRLYDSVGRLRTTRVSDLKGRYSIFAAAGSYLLDALNRAFDVQSNEVRMRLAGIIPKHIRLQRIPGAPGSETA